jgi:hypothetical protein
MTLNEIHVDEQEEGEPKPIGQWNGNSKVMGRTEVAQDVYRELVKFDGDGFGMTVRGYRTVRYTERPRRREKPIP